MITDKKAEELEQRGLWRRAAARWQELLLNYLQWICPYISRHLLSLNPLLACCRRYSRGER